MKTETKYKILSHTFIGENEGHCTYQITFNQSLEHTGRFNGIENGLNTYVKEEQSTSGAYIWHSFIRWIKSL